jgi:hypothetical protein
MSCYSVSLVDASSGDGGQSLLSARAASAKVEVHNKDIQVAVQQAYLAAVRRANQVAANLLFHILLGLVSLPLHIRLVKRQGAGGHILDVWVTRQQDVHSHVADAENDLVEAMTPPALMLLQEVAKANAHVSVLAGGARSSHCPHYKRAGQWCCTALDQLCEPTPGHHANTVSACSHLEDCGDVAAPAYRHLGVLAIPHQRDARIH